MTVSVEYASEHLPDLISALENGEAVQITRNQKPSLQLSIHAEPRTEKLAPRPRSELFGCLKGQLWMSEDWDSPEVNEEIANEFLNGDNDKELLGLLERMR